MPGGMPCAMPFMRPPREPLWRIFLALIAEELRAWRCRVFDHSPVYTEVGRVACRRCGKRWP